MKGVAVSLAFFAAACCFSQAIDLNRPILSTGPDAQGPTVGVALDVARLAAAHGYNGVSFGIGLRRMVDPSKISLYGVRQVTREALRLGLKYVCIRLDHEIPVNQAWADRYNGGSLWPIASRPPSGSWARIAQIWSVARDTAVSECTAAGRDPKTTLIFVLSNEPGMGGVGGPSLGSWSTVNTYYNNYLRTGSKTEFLKAFPEEFYGKPEGYIEPGFWKMLRYLRSRVSLGGYRTYAVGFEAGESSIPGQVASTVGADAEWLFANATGFAFNVFAPSALEIKNKLTGAVIRPALTAEQAALEFRLRVERNLQALLSGPILSNERALYTEFNLPISRIPPGMDPYLYRMPILREAMKIQGLDGSAIYAFFGNDGFQLFTRAVSDGITTITPVGSHAVGPKYLSAFPP